MSQQPPTYSPNYQTPPPDETISTLIPYRNVPALISYYVGLFSLFPCLGALMGPIAVVLGIIGLKRAAKNPSAKGKVHAWVGIICGAVFGFIWILLDILLLIGLFLRPTSHL